MKSAIYLGALWKDAQNFSGGLSYSTQYDLNAIQEDITQLIALQAAGLPPTVQRELMRACLQKVLPNLDERTQNQINCELDRIGAVADRLTD